MAKKNKSYINREISWLSFNARVLQEAADPSVPLVERLKFLGIFSSNLDEFYRVRVGTLKRMQKAAVRSKSYLFGETPAQVLKEIQEIVLQQRQEFDKIFTQLYEELARHRIFVINEKQLTDEQARFILSYFQQEVRPRLVPIILSSLPEFPDLKNQVIYLAIHLFRERDQKVKFALIEIPVDVLPRFIVLPETDSVKNIIMLDDVIRFGLKDIFATFDFDKIEAYTIKLTRDAELDIEDDVTKSDFEKISKSLKQRKTGQPVRFVYDREMPADLLDFILKSNKLKNFDNSIPGGRYHNAKDFMNFPNVGDPSLVYPKSPPLLHEWFEKHKSMFNAIYEKDVLLVYPYYSFHYLTDLLREAAIDPKVISIKMALYRVAKHSNVVNALINAKRNGKRISVLLELKARFDEEANIYWTERLEEEGAHLVNSVPGLKVHAKLCLITRKEGKKLVNYAIIGTGNFNESTARIYSDHALFTAQRHITAEVVKVFEFLENNYKTHIYKHLLVAPFDMRKKLSRMIKNEIKNARAGKKAAIYLKLNNLVDRKMIDKLYEASQAGVKIKMIIRGICSLVPGIDGLSENIEVISIVDKYLEHSRIIIFYNGGDEQYFISSADWMIRNLDNRVEVAVPIIDKDLQDELKQFMILQFSDGQKARIINAEQDNRYRRLPPGQSVRAQEAIYDMLKKRHEPVHASEA